MVLRIVGYPCTSSLNPEPVHASLRNVYTLKRPPSASHSYIHSPVLTLAHSSTLQHGPPGLGSVRSTVATADMPSPDVLTY